MKKLVAFLSTLVLSGSLALAEDDHYFFKKDLGIYSVVGNTGNELKEENPYCFLKIFFNNPNDNKNPGAFILNHDLLEKRSKFIVVHPMWRMHPGEDLYTALFTFESKRFPDSPYEMRLNYRIIESTAIIFDEISPEFILAFDLNDYLTIATPGNHGTYFTFPLKGSKKMTDVLYDCLKAYDRYLNTLE